ncbi:hypothetical protein BegalDRAFT_3478 [Beggiatoa alba B18LD]|uniref:Uncharacterized protein n=1 Tax=Beggiatoa alba B18LD TaxID=395493 RepID=I3CKZ7_9GAMM|nr:hypothetical protein [Beggiatoa alba]EIJ44290.1 hypothetical protein BegalDRAFT_3478 [Beggiatoa alba B18LD]
MAKDSPESLYQRLIQTETEVKNLLQQIETLDITKPSPITLKERDIGYISQSLIEQIKDENPARVRAVLSMFLTGIEIENETITVFFKPESLFNTSDCKLFRSMYGIDGVWRP